MKNIKFKFTIKINSFRISLASFNGIYEYLIKSLHMTIQVQILINFTSKTFNCLFLLFGPIDVNKWIDIYNNDWE